MLTTPRAVLVPRARLLLGGLQEPVFPPWRDKCCHSPAVAKGTRQAAAEYDPGRRQVCNPACDLAVRHGGHREQQQQGRHTNKKRRHCTAQRDRPWSQTGAHTSPDLSIGHSGGTNSAHDHCSVMIKRALPAVLAVLSAGSVPPPSLTSSLTPCACVGVGAGLCAGAG